MKQTSEAAFEAAIAAVLLVNGYSRVEGKSFDRERAIFPTEALAFIQATQAKVWEKIEALHGGHSIPMADIERRFPRSLRHLFNDFSHRVNSCICFMNNGGSPVLVFEQREENRDILHEDFYQLLLDEAER
jgi:hypothetical protein